MATGNIGCSGTSLSDEHAFRPRVLLSMTLPRSLPRCTGASAAALSSLAVLTLLANSQALAEKVVVTINGLDEQMLESARANLELKQYEERDVSPAEARRLFDRGSAQI